MKELKKKLEKIEKNLFKVEPIDFSFDKKWTNHFPKEAGVYAIYDKSQNNKLVYIGETANIKERMKEIKRTYNHSFRRQLGKKIGNVSKSPKGKFAPELEEKLDNYFTSFICVCALSVDFGRLEAESFLIHKYKANGLLNSIGKRNVLKFEL